MNAEDAIERGDSAARAWASRMLRHLFPHWGLWIAVLCLLALNLGWVMLSPRIRVGEGFALTCLGALAASGVILFYREIRHHAADEIFDRLIKTLIALMFALLMMKNLQVFNHLAMTLPFPLADHWLIAWDHALGFDWNAYAMEIAQRPWLKDVLLFAYNSLTNVMIGVILVALIALGMPGRVNELAYLVLASGFICISVSAMLPAEAAWNTLAQPEVKAILGGTPGGDWLDQFKALRSGGAIDLGSRPLTGLATFPSFHTCLGLIILWCSRGHWATFIPGAAAGLAVIAATPVFGGHYVTDLLGGAAVMLALIMLWHWRPAGQGGA